MQAFTTTSLKSASLKSVIVAGAAAVALTGCSSDAKNDASDAASKATSAASSAAGSASAAASSASSSATTSSASSAAPSSSSPASSASSSASSTQQAPAGMQMVTAPVAKISFPVPSDWAVITEASANDPALLKKLEPLAKRDSTSAEKLTKLYTSSWDVFALDPAAATIQNPVNLNVVKASVPALLTKEQFTKALQGSSSLKIKPTLGEYSKINTPAGQGAQMTYSLSANGKSQHGVSMEVPNGSGTYAQVTVAASTAAEAEKMAKDVAASVHKL